MGLLDLVRRRRTAYYLDRFRRDARPETAREWSETLEDFKQVRADIQESGEQLHSDARACDRAWRYAVVLQDLTSVLALDQRLAPAATLIRIFEKGIEAAERLPDRPLRTAVQAILAARIGTLEVEVGRLPRAQDFFDFAARSAREIGNSKLLAGALTGWATALALQGQTGEAAAKLGEAQRAAHEAPDSLAEAVALFHVGQLHRRAGRCQEAVDRYGEALAIFRREHRDDLETGVLFELGVVCARIGKHDAALGLLNDCLKKHRLQRSTCGEARTRVAIGDAWLGAGDAQAAAGEFELAAELSRACWDRITLGRANFGLGLVARLAGDRERSLERLTSALELARECSDPEGEAQARAELDRLTAGHS